MTDDARSLGLHAAITRRDFMGATLLESGVMLSGAGALKQVFQVIA